jgi:DNA repair protein RadC
MTQLDRPTYSTMIRDMPEGERPRERLVRYGANTLSNAELIAILLRTGVTGEGVISMSNRLLSEYGGLAGMGRVSYGELCSVNGISEAKACQLLAALELGRRLVSLSPNDRPIIVSPSDVANLLSAEMGFLDQEHLRVLLLSTKSEVLGIHEVYKGTVNSAAVRVAEVLRPAIRENCPSIIVVHNHPSGDPAPSSQDIMITRQINQAAEMMDIELLDHIIIGGQNHLSMKNKGLGFRAS